MRINTNDLTLQQNYLEKFRFSDEGVWTGQVKEPSKVQTSCWFFTKRTIRNRRIFSSTTTVYLCNSLAFAKNLHGVPSQFVRVYKSLN